MDTDRLSDLYAFLYTNFHFYAHGNLYPDPEFYTGHALGDTYTFHHILPQPIT